MNKSSDVSLEIAADAASVFAALTESSALEGWFAEHAEVSRESGRFAFWGKYTSGNPDREEGSGRLLGWKQDAELSFEWRARGVPGVVSLTLASTWPARSLLFDTNISNRTVATFTSMAHGVFRS